MNAMAKTKSMIALQKAFPIDCKVKVTVSGCTGKVVGYRFSTNAQGGTVRVRWDKNYNAFSENEANIGPINLERI